jgi:hypothetical protein
MNENVAVRYFDLAMELMRVAEKYEAQCGV